MDQMTIEAMRDVESLLNDAARERANGLGTTDAEMMTEHLVTALARVLELEGKAEDVATVQNELDAANEEIEEHEKKIEALEKERGEARAEAARLDGELDAADKRIADLESSMAPSQATDALASLRSDVAISGARLNCGMDSSERAAYRFCLRADLPDGPCAACSIAKMQRENDGLKNTVDVIRGERDRFLIEAQTKAARVVKVKPARAPTDGTPTLFALMPQHSMTAPTMKRRRKKPVH